MLLRRCRLRTVIFLVAFGQSCKTFCIVVSFCPSLGFFLNYCLICSVEFQSLQQGIPEGNQEGKHLLAPPSTHDVNMGAVSFHASLTWTKRPVEDGVETALVSARKTGVRLCQTAVCHESLVKTVVVSKQN